MRSLLPSTVYTEDPMQELNQYNSLFCSGNPSTEPYEMVIVLQDGSRWKLDPNKAQKLCSLISADQITRFECIFKPASRPQFEESKRHFQAEMHRDTINIKECGLRSMDQAL